MKSNQLVKRTSHAFLALLVMSLADARTTLAQSNISPVNKWSWGENAGWSNWFDDGLASGAFVGEYVLSGFVWAENLGWIYLGDGTPAAGNYYGNATAADTGVNISADGSLFGFAWAENAGWINFDTAPVVGVLRARLNACCPSGRLTGYAWGENVGWINLESAFAYVGLSPAAIRAKADMDGNSLRNGLDIAWFIRTFLNPAASSAFRFCAADMNSDGLLSDADVALFVNCLLNGTCICP
jgi:hypothetical protein